MNYKIINIKNLSNYENVWKSLLVESKFFWFFNNLEYYKLLITGYNKPDNKISIRIEFYIKSSYLLKLYELSVIPLIIYKLINCERLEENWESKFIHIPIILIYCLH